MNDLEAALLAAHWQLVLYEGQARAGKNPSPAARDEALEEFARLWAVTPGEIWRTDGPELAEAFAAVQAVLATRYNDFDLSDEVEGVAGYPSFMSWLSRVWDVLPTVAIALPAETAQVLYREAVHAYLHSLDLACVAMARATAEQVAVELHRNVQPVVSMSSRRSKRSFGLSSAVRDLEASGALSDREVAAFELVRQRGNRVLHEGSATADDARACLAALRTILAMVGR